MLHKPARQFSTALEVSVMRRKGVRDGMGGAQSGRCDRQT